MVAHSAGGFLAGEAVQNLDVGAGQKAGQVGGVVRLAFVTAVLLLEGGVHEALPFFDVQVGECCILVGILAEGILG